MQNIILYKLSNFKRRRVIEYLTYKYSKKNNLSYKETLNELKKIAKDYCTNVQFLIAIDYLNKKDKSIILNFDFYLEVFKINPKGIHDLLDNKLNVYDRCKKFIKRDYLEVKKENKEECLKFIQNHKKFVGKRNYGSGGECFCIYEHNNKNPLKIYNQILKNKNVILEEFIVQHDVINKIHKYSVNTIRIHTVNNGKKIKTFLKPKMRIGCNKSILDTHSPNGSAYRLILNNDGSIAKSGYIDSNMIMKKANYHHNSKVYFSKIKIPYVKEAIEMVKEAALLFPEVGLIGWDVAITNEGPVLVEGNIMTGAIENYQWINYIYGEKGIKKELEEMMNFATSSKGKRI